MFHRLTATAPREFAKWCTYALFLLVPGSVVIFPVLWLSRRYRARAAWPGNAWLIDACEKTKGGLTMDDRESVCGGLRKEEPAGLVQRLRHWCTPQDGAEQYLAEAVDLADLERRMRALERASGGPAFVTFKH